MNTTCRAENSSLPIGATKNPIEIYGETLYQAGKHGGDLIDIIDFSNPLDTIIADEEKRRKREDTLAVLLLDSSARKEAGSISVARLHNSFLENVKDNLARLGYTKAESLFCEQVETNLESGQIATGLYAEVRRNGKIKYVSAGHPAPLLINDKEITQLNSQGEGWQPLLFRGSKMKNFRTTYGNYVINPGETMVCFTDGLEDHYKIPTASQVNEERGGRWFDIIGDTIQQFYKNPQELVIGLREHILNHGTLSDDISYLVVRRHDEKREKNDVT